MDIRIIQTVLDVFDHYGEPIRFDKERFEEALNDEAPELCDECYLVVRGMGLGIYDAMMFDENGEDIEIGAYVDALIYDFGFSEEEAVFVIHVFYALIKQMGYYFEVGDIEEVLEQAYADNQFVHMYIVAKSFFYGTGVRQDYTRAFEIFNYLKEHQDYSGAYYLGYMYEYGFGIEEDKEKANECYFLGNDDLCFYKMGMHYYRKHDDQYALTCFEKSQYEKSFYYKGKILENRKEYADAFMSYHQGAKRYQGDCLYKIGKMLDEGIGTLKDKEEALKYFKLGYYALHKECAFELGYRNIQQGNIKMGLGILKQAALLESVSAAMLLAKYYENGQYVDKNIKIANKYYDFVSQNMKRGEECEGI